MESSSSGWYTRISDLWMTVTAGIRTLGSGKHGQAAKAYTKLPNPEPLYQNTWVPNIENFVDATYIGSFSVVGEDQKSRAEYVRKQLADMREVTKSKPVLLVISLSGIKVCSSNGESVYMAHALKRISYATCDPEYGQFSFLAREPKGQTNVQYCHAFITKTPEEAEELNNIVGNAFQMAYAYQRQIQQQQQSQKPSFNDMIQKQIEDQKAKYDEYNEQKQKTLQQKLQQISTPTIAQRVKERRDQRQEQQRAELEEKHTRLASKEKMSWAKQIVGRTRHKLPYSEDPHWQAITANLSSVPSAPLDGRASQRSSIVSIKEAFDTSEFHGSPVMVLKEKIDNHFNGHVTCADVHSSDATDGVVENYLNPVISPTNQNVDNKISTPSPSPSTESRKGPNLNDSNSAANEISPSQSDLHNRPLPATPTEEKRSRRKSKSREGRKSHILGEKSDEGSSPSPSRNSLKGNSSNKLSNGSGSGIRPASVAYQNDSPIHIRGTSDIPDNGELYMGPPTPARYDSLRKLDPSALPEDEDQLKAAPWYQAGIPREIALDMLAQQEIGSFVVRDSTTHPNCYALSVKVPKFENPTGISHYLIHRSSRGGVKLKGLDKEWPTMTALVTHHTVMPEMLPCTLRLPRNSNNPSFKDSEDKEDREEDEDYQKLADFSNMMAHLKM